MRTPDPLYIVNFINQVVGKGLIARITNNWSLYPTVWRLYEAVGPKIEQHLMPMNPAKLAEIIRYSNPLVAVGVPPIQRRARMDHLAVRDCLFGELKFNEWNILNGLLGDELLKRAALFSILVVIMDMTHQEMYRADDAALAQEQEDEELLQRHYLPPDHPLHGKPLEVRY